MIDSEKWLLCCALSVSEHICELNFVCKSNAHAPSNDYKWIKRHKNEWNSINNIIISSQFYWLIYIWAFWMKFVNNWSLKSVYYPQNNRNNLLKWCFFHFPMHWLTRKGNWHTILAMPYDGENILPHRFGWKYFIFPLSFAAKEFPTEIPRIFNTAHHVCVCLLVDFTGLLYLRPANRFIW